MKEEREVEEKLVYVRLVLKIGDVAIIVRQDILKENLGRGGMYMQLLLPMRGYKPLVDWFFDSTTPKHMINRRSWFVEFVEEKSKPNIHNIWGWQETPC